MPQGLFDRDSGLMTAIVRAGETGIDSSFSHPPTSALVAHGFTFRVGYLSVPPASPGKNITVQECTDTLAAGMKLLFVFEMSATRATLGASYGTLDGAAAKQEALARGLPTDVPILMADDTGTNVTNLPNKIAYMQAAAVSAKPFDIGIYGGVKILAPLVGLWKIGWVPVSAWSWSVNLTRLPGETTAAYNARGRAAAEQAARDVGAHVLQGPSYVLDGTWAIDPNTAIADFPAWGTATDPPPPSGDDEMPTVFGNSQVGKYGSVPWPQGGCSLFALMPDGSYRTLGYGEWITLGAPMGVGQPDSVIDAIPVYVPPLTSIPPIVVPPADVDEAAIAAAVVAALPPAPTGGSWTITK